MEDSKHTAEPWAHRNGRIYQADRDVLTIANIARASDGDYSEANARRIVACVNACAGIDTEHLEQAQADHAEESEGGYLADVETRLEHTERELAHRSAALFERQQRVLSVMDELRQAVEARLAAEAQRDKLLDVLKLLRRELKSCQGAIYLAGGFDPAYVIGALAAISKADAIIAAVEGGAEC